MDQDTYLKLALRTEVTPLFVNDAEGKPSLFFSRAMHAAMGMVTEAAEVMDMLKKCFVYGKKFDIINALEEVGDGQWYSALMLQAIGYDFREAFSRNIAKLLRRYPDQFTTELALNRDLDAEREVLEKPAAQAQLPLLRDLLSEFFNRETPVEQQEWVDFQKDCLPQILAALK